MEAAVKAESVTIKEFRPKEHGFGFQRKEFFPQSPLS
jgi:hypothetical protein